jgi:hypothetical protein
VRTSHTRGAATAGWEQPNIDLNKSHFRPHTHRSII